VHWRGGALKALKEFGLEGEEQSTSEHAEVGLPVVHLRLLRHTVWCATLVGGVAWARGRADRFAPTAQPPDPDRRQVEPLGTATCGHCGGGAGACVVDVGMGQDSPPVTVLPSAQCLAGGWLGRCGRGASCDAEGRVVGAA